MKKAPPICWMPEMPTARIATPTMVPQTLTRPGLIVVEPRKARPGPAAGIRGRRWPARSKARRQQQPGEGAEHAGGHEGADDEAPARDAVQLGGPGIGADRIEAAADRKKLAGNP